jgi:hydroxymethylpyrimidine/phosphomethylpyrimidine kinase
VPGNHRRARASGPDDPGPGRRRPGPPVALTIAGSDSGAGAGLQADLKAFAALGVFATTVVTAVTAQSTAAVYGVDVVDPAFVARQMEAVLGDMAPSAVKTGMLASSATVALVAEWAGRGALPNLVVDPVLESSSGQPLLDDGGVAAYVDLLLPHAVVATPNIGEAARLLGEEAGAIVDVGSMMQAARRLAALGPGTVVVKGGHLPGPESPDVLVHDGTVTVLEGRRVVTANDHGSGCTLSAAVAAGLALGLDPPTSVRRAKAYVARAISGATRWHLGAGHGPLDHFGWGSSPTRGGAADGAGGPAMTTG